MNKKAANKKASVSFIFATIFIDALGIGLLIPVFPDVLRRFNADPSFVSHYYGYFISLYSLMQLFASPILGSLSDRYGRRPILLVSLFFAALDYLLMAFAPTLTLLFVGRIISGLTGANITVASSYMADISDDSNRAANFGMIGAAFGAGFIVGPGIGGLLVNSGMEAPFIVAAVLNLANGLFGYFILPESLPPEQRRKVELKRLNPFTSLVKAFKTPNTSHYVWIYFFLYLLGQVHPSIWTIYTQYRYQWSTFEVGMSLSFAGVMMAIGQGYLTRIIIPLMGEARALYYGIWLEFLCCVLFAWASEGWMMYAIMLLFSVSCITNPAVQSLVSKDVPSSEQGELQGSLISIASLTAIIGPLLYTELFARFTDNAGLLFPGAPYLASAALAVVTLGIFFLTKNKLHHSTNN